MHLRFEGFGRIMHSYSAIEENLRKHVDMLAGVIGPRDFSQPTHLAAAAAYIERVFSSLEDHVERQDYDTEDGVATNLIVERKGTRDPASIVVLGAHYDTVSGTPGADDNASAVAVLIEVARLLRGVPSIRTVRYVAFACEEPPHFFQDTMGSLVYARRCRERSENILGMLCLEMVGYFRDEPGSQKAPWLPKAIRWLRRIFPTRGNFLTAVGNLKSIPLAWTFDRGFKRHSSLPIFTICLPDAIDEIHLSDNSSFWKMGYPALMLTDTSFLRNENYHRASDTPETLDYGRMAKVATGVAGAVARLAKMKTTSHFAPR